MERRSFIESHETHKADISGLADDDIDTLRNLLEQSSRYFKSIKVLIDNETRTLHVDAIPQPDNTKSIAQIVDDLVETFTRIPPQAQ